MCIVYIGYFDVYSATIMGIDTVGSNIVCATIIGVDTVGSNIVCAI